MGASNSGPVIHLPPEWISVQRDGDLLLMKEPDGMLFNGKYVLLGKLGPDQYAKLATNLSENVGTKAFRALKPFTQVQMEPAVLQNIAALWVSNMGKYDHCSPLHMLVHARAPASVLRHAVRGPASFQLSARDRNGSTPLHCAVAARSLACTRELLNLRANPNEAQTDGATALHLAVEEGQSADMVGSLLETKTANIEVRDFQNYTPLHRAVIANNSGALQALVAHGADSTALVANGVQALHLAASHGSERCLMLLLHMPATNVNCTDDMGNSPLHTACEVKDDEHIRRKAGRLVTALVDCKANVNLANISGMTALHCAAYVNSHDAALTLIRRGRADTQALDNDRNTPLHTAVKAGHARTVRVLTTQPDVYEINLEQPNKYGETCLHLAANDDASLRWLLEVQCRQLQRANEELRTILDQTTMQPSLYQPPSLSRSSSAQVLEEKNRLVLQMEYLQKRCEQLQSSLQESKQLNEELKKQSQVPECSVCLVEQVNIAFVPCGHVCVCVGCSTRVSMCPLCRANIRTKLRIYTAYT